MGKQIRIYLADGTSTGIRHAEITNWSGQALACPRPRFSELKDWGEIKRPGVYFLLGTNEESGEDAVYIGESEVVLDRLSAHLTGKNFWSELIAFTSKDDNLTKGHVKYLESRLIQLASSANRYQVTNTASPQLPALPRADKDSMEEYLISVRALLGVLGHRVLDPYTQPAHTSAFADSKAPMQPQQGEIKPPELQPETFVPVLFALHIGGISATAERTDEGLVVLAGSEAITNAQGSLSGGYRALREKLLLAGTLEPANGKLRLTKDQLFSSPSQAAAVLVGYAINGRDAWRLKDGTTYGDYEQKISSDLLKQLTEEK
ncbi:MAG: GIY-YIG nuclease family protein [Limnobacter sp.]|uniref:GIY-YIG nuclease family protein n=1 Tax=Limnobacter sp. TaxID=2003368 RepID=UPI003919D2E7